MLTQNFIYKNNSMGPEQKFSFSGCLLRSLWLFSHCPIHMYNIITLLCLGFKKWASKLQRIGLGFDLLKTHLQWIRKSEVSSHWIQFVFTSITFLHEKRYFYLLWFNKWWSVNQELCWNKNQLMNIMSGVVTSHDLLLWKFWKKTMISTIKN